MAIPDTTAVLVFDFDGVILESVNVKDEAFRDLFPGTTVAERQAILQFHRSTPGIHRRCKIRRMLVEVLGREANEALVEDALERFHARVWSRLMDCEEVPGVRAFLEARRQVPKYVVSAAPQEELRQLAQARNFSHYFRGVLGSPPGKTDLLGKIIRQEAVPPGQVLMIGDKTADLKAATRAGCRFIGRETPQNPTAFPEGTRVIRSFTA